MPDLSISAFKTKVVTAGGWQRDNRFFVKFNETPDAVTTLLKTDAIDDDGMPSNYIAETVILPSTIVLTQADSLSGPGAGRTSPRGVTYKDGVTITFPLFQNMELLHAMNTWCRLLYGPMSGDNDNPWTVSYYGFGGLNIPATSLDVTALDLNGKATYAYTFYEVFPVEVFPLQFSSLNTNGILKLMVRFAFRTYNFTIPQS